MNKEENNFGHISSCQICNNTTLEKVASLGHHAPVHAHLTKTQLDEKEISYPLNLCKCTECGLLQLDYIVDPKIIFHANYPYFTGMTNMLINNFRDLCEILIEKHDAKENDLVVDIGSNDGTLLTGFKEKGMKVLGIEPTDVADVANSNGIETLKEFFTDKTVEKIIQEHGKAKVVTATNMFAHVNDATDLANNVSSLLNDDGVFVSESQYLVDMLEKTALDTIYHEHLRYYSLKPLQKLLELAGMSVIDAERIDSAGGSIRVYAKKGEHKISKRAQDILNKEEEMGIYNGEVFVDFEKKINSIKHNLNKLLRECKENGKIVGIGAPGRSNTLLNFAKIDTNLIDYAVEKKGSPKIGLFTPGMHIPIIDEEIVFKEQPEYALILSWHIGTELMDIFRKKGYKGKFITPLPEPKIIND